MQITISTTVNAPMERVWSAWTTPADITKWNFASDDWCCPAAELDFSPGGGFSYRMEAKDGSMGFDFAGTFEEIEPMKIIKFVLGDERTVTVSFSKSSGGNVIVKETFEADDAHSAEQQRLGWQAILENFRVHVESSST